MKTSYLVDKHCPADNAYVAPKSTILGFVTKYDTLLYASQTEYYSEEDEEGEW